MEPGVGSDIGDCFDSALRIAEQLDVVVIFDFNEVHCGVRPCDAGDEIREMTSKELFLRNYRTEGAKTTGCKICYANR